MLFIVNRFETDCSGWVALLYLGFKNETMDGFSAILSRWNNLNNLDRKAETGSTSMSGINSRHKSISCCCTSRVQRCEKVKRGK